MTLQRRFYRSDLQICRQGDKNHPPVFRVDQNKGGVVPPNQRSARCQMPHLRHKYVHLSRARHREDEPSHISFKDSALLAEDNRLYDSPATRFCPAEVYEKKEDEQGRFTDIQLNFSNCLHCKTCVIKDPLQNIVWAPPEGGEGPKYKRM